jgi:predicted metal-binding protein
MNAHSGPSAAATLVVCVTCKSEAGPMGPGLFEALAERLSSEPGVALKAVECLSVCKRPCTVALAAPGKWTYVVGDLDRDLHLEDIVIGARRYAASPDGVVPWRERPLCFRKGVVSRTPPLASVGMAPA